MSLSPMVAEWVAAYEQEHGCKPAESVLRIAEHILKVGKMLREQGAKDAQAGKQPRHQEAHEALVRYVFQLEPEEDVAFVEGLAELWQFSYMKGTRKEVQLMENKIFAPAFPEADFAVIVEGDGMKDDRIFDGDIIYFRAQDTAEDGQITAVLIDGMTHIGRHWKTEWGFILTPSNSAYSSQLFRAENWLPEILGIAVAAHIHIPSGTADT